MKSKLIIAVLLIALVCTFCVSCGPDNAAYDDVKAPETNTEAPSETDEPEATAADDKENEEEEYVSASDKFTKFDTRISYDKSTAVYITLADSATSVTGDGATVSGDVVTVGKAGTYVFKGKLSNGQIVVDVEKTEKVQLVFDGVSVKCMSSAPLYIKSADKVAITLEEGTVNTLEDSATYANQNEKGEPNACIFSKDDLTINGYGTLTVVGNYNNGIASKNDIKLVSGNITVTAVNNGIKGKGSITVNSGTIKVVSEDDGIKSDDDNDSEKGYVVIEGGTLEIQAEDDAITAYNSVVISGGSVTVKAGGKSVNCDGTVNIKTGTLVEK